MVDYVDKPNYKQPAFWATILVIVSSVLYLLGIIKPEDKAGLEGGIPGLVDGIAIAVGIITIVVRQIKAKVAAKKPKPKKKKKHGPTSRPSGTTDAKHPEDNGPQI